MLIDSLRPQFDIIIIDTPPVGLVTDGILIMQNVDVPIYVLKANYSKKIFTKNINRLIQTNNFSNLAVILNAVKRTRAGYGYGGYGYGGYGYGYGGYYEDEKEGRWAKIWKRLFKKADKEI
ncbi:MAG: hypothetical protein HC913_02550 [Microscillaceae bacterium]|nr:hypothetical protein [Microscillaceae bacterium]